MCSLVKSFTLIGGQPHTLVVGPRLARMCLVKKALVTNQVTYDITRGKGLLSSAHLARLETRGVVDSHGLPLVGQLCRCLS